MRTLSRSFAIATLLLLSACFPQWDRPAFATRAVPMPYELEGIWATEGSSQQILMFKKSLSKSTLTILNDDGVFEFPIQFSKYSDISIASIYLGGMRKLNNLPFNGLAGVRRDGYMIFEFEKNDMGEIVVRSVLDIEDIEKYKNQEVRNLCNFKSEASSSFIEMAAQAPCHLLSGSILERRTPEAFREGLTAPVIVLRPVFR